MRKATEKIVEAVLAKVAHDHTHMNHILDQMDDRELDKLELACIRIVDVIKNRRKYG